MKTPRLHACLFAAVLLFLSSCSTVKPPVLLPPEPDAESTARVFSHEDFDAVLKAFVDDKGRVDYAGLKENMAAFNAYYSRLAQISPDSHPELFPDEKHRLAYWINAYNAGAFAIVLDHYPISSVTGVKNPTLFPFFGNKAGFFFFHRIILGGEKTSLYTLENSLIRKRFLEPRIHFALNCASTGCPMLPPEAFRGEIIDRQLEREGRKFMAEDRNVRVVHTSQTVFLSEIFDWFEEDFEDWMEAKFPNKPATLLAYLIKHAGPSKKADLSKAQEAGYTIEYTPYDWSLNDQNPGE
jgi:hypothetical protein